MRALELGQIRGTMGKQAAKIVALALVRAVITGGGRTRGAFTLVWVVATDKRLLLCKTDRYHQTVGQPFSMLLDDITVTSSGTILRTLEVTKAATGEPVVRINFGLRKGALENIRRAMA